MRTPVLIAAALIAACSGNASPAAQGRTGSAGADAALLTVIELFQSQGCSSCPPANANVNALADRPGVLALSFAVTYWDQLGWKDRFAQPAFTQRQRDYATSGQSDGVYTPQVVINGSRAVVGANAATLGKAIRAQGALTNGPTLALQGSRLSIGQGTAASPAKVLLVTYDPQVRRVPIKAGENTGKTLPHRNIVTDLAVAGTWTGKPLRIDLPTAPDPALRRAVLLQQGTGGRLIAAMKL